MADGIKSLSVQLDRAQKLYATWVAVQGTLSSASRIVALADAWNEMSARLKLATAGQREYTVAQSALFAIVQRSGLAV